MFNIVTTVGNYILFILESFKVTLKGLPRWSLIADHMVEIGIMSLPVVAITGFSTGLVLAAQTFFQLADKGLSAATGILVGKAMITELGPVLTAFMVTGRVGSAMCAELGTMKVSEQIDAMRSMAISPMRHLVVPRKIAGIVTIPLLTVFSIVMGIVGGYLISTYFFEMPPQTYFNPMPDYITPFDLFIGVSKSFVFSFVIVTISCFAGINTSGGAAGVGKSITVSVVVCYSVILISNFFLTMALTLLSPLFGRFAQ
ncbi:MAG: putative phospholipid ABC transporter permease protein MlaE [Chlamydiae bacterium]|nr:putative phospholipid ABC transporter permease protein MlaE [Chlamydiota bacterium]